MLHFAGFSNNPTNAVFHLADSLQNEGELQWAATEFERVAYSANSNTMRTEALLKKAECQLLLNQPEAAYATTERLYYNGLHDSLHYAARYNSAFYAFLSKDFEQANSQLLLIQQFLPDSLSMNSSILHALTLNELRQWDESVKKLTSWAHYTFRDDSVKLDSTLAAIDGLYNPKKYPKYKDPEKAQIMSSIAPGLGQLYAGRFWDAAFSAGMVVASLGLGAYGVFVLNYYVTGAVLGYTVFQRFYTAGQKRSDFLARKYNYEKLREHNDAIMNPVLSLSK